MKTASAWWPIAAIGWAHALGACELPIHGAAAKPLGTGDASTVTMLPPGARCALPSTPSDVPTGESMGSRDTRCADAGPPPQFDFAHPLGVGYAEISDELPQRVAYLTFDDGPSDWTNEFLDILKAKHVLATFFITVRGLKGPAGLDGTYTDPSGRVWAYRDVLRRVVDEGHLIANHTVNHPDFGGITREQIQAELDATELLVSTALVRAGGTPRLLSLFRPPFGAPWQAGTAVPVDTAAAQIAASQRIAMHGLNIMWNISSTDAFEWAQGESPSRTQPVVKAPEAPTFAEKVARITRTVLDDANVARGNGIVVLMHDTHNATRDALPAVIDGLSSAGYSFDTIESYVKQRWNRPSLDLTPGPSTYASCIEPRNWGCESFGVPVGTDRSREVCGRMWLAYHSLGGADVLGAPAAAPTESAESGIVSQSFERGVIELHPENPPPCNVVLVPR
jgi:peptidoglycan/xylan/chitin deacetylase (PgdA/CDA1 family)